jgi:iron-sulfur cluster assembly accessory protein
MSDTTVTKSGLDPATLSATMSPVATIEHPTDTLISLTPVAASKIRELMAEEEDAATLVLRVAIQGGGCSGFQYGLMIDEGEGDASTDAVIESNGVKLLVDPISARYLRGAEVDFVDNVTGGGFTIKNPNAKSTCGCGSSFSV